MSKVPAREALEAMKRTDIQKLCKDYGVKANLKTEALIDLLLDASRPQASRPIPSQPSRRPSTTRIPSLTPRPREQSSGSVIIHDETEEKDHVVAVNPILDSQSSRTRKAKQTQYRLGVGRPVLAGGSGARAITKSASITRSARGTKSSRSIQPSEATIAEETEPEPEVNAGVTLESKETSPMPSNPMWGDGLRAETEPSIKPMDAAIAQALAPVQEELDSQKSQLAELKAKVTAIIESFEAKIRDLSSEVEILRAQAKDSTSRFHGLSMSGAHDQLLRIPEPPSTPKRVRSPPLISFSTKPLTSEVSSDTSHTDTLTHNDGRSQMEPRTGSLLPGFPHSTLGKRSRDPTSNDFSGMCASGKDDKQADTELESEGDRPAQKRPKLFTDEGELEPSQTHSKDPSVSSESPRASRFSRLSVQDDRPHGDPRPPNFYEGPPSPPLMSAPTITSSANNAENQNPFSFSFLPIASTPAQAVYPVAMGTFPYPEPPTSPSPVNTVSNVGPSSHHSERLGTIGLPRSSSRASGPISHVHVVASGSGELQRVPSSNEVASGLGLTAIKTSATDVGTPVPPVTRTMYGTELEEDTRFGDFGVEGVASGFWARGRF